MRAPNKPTIRKPRGRPRKDPMDKCGDAVFMAALNARVIADYHRPRQETRELLLIALKSARAKGLDPYPILDQLQMLDTLAVMEEAKGMVREERHLSHKEALRRTWEWPALDGADQDKALDTLRRMRTLRSRAKKMPK
jgi:hypothetical protein